MRGGVCLYCKSENVLKIFIEKFHTLQKNENRTIAQQVVVLLEKSLEQQESNIGRRKRLIDRLEKRQIASEIKKIDPVSFIRDDRNR